MIYVIYVLGGGFMLLGAAMFFVCYRHRHFGLFMMALSYWASGLLAIMLPHWWPLILGFVLVWVLRLLGLEPTVKSEEEGEETKPEGENRKTEG